MDNFMLPLLSYDDTEDDSAVLNPTSSSRCASTIKNVAIVKLVDNSISTEVDRVACSSLVEASSTGPVAAGDAKHVAAAGPLAEAQSTTMDARDRPCDGQMPSAAAGSSCPENPARSSDSTVSEPLTASTTSTSTTANASSSSKPSVSDKPPVSDVATSVSPSSSAPAARTRDAADRLAQGAAATKAIAGVKSGDEQKEAGGKGEVEEVEEEDLPPPDSLDDFEVRRRRAVFTAMLLLLEHGARDPDHLSHLVAPMSGEELQQVAEERALAGRCGNPLCAATHSVTRPPPRRRWDPEAGFVEPPPPSHFCSAACELLIESYAAQLGNPLERLQPGLRELLPVSHAPRRPGMENVAAQGGGVATMLAEIKERDPAATAAAAVAAGRELDRLAAEVAAADGGSSGSGVAGGGSRAVEGYVPGSGKRRPPPRPLPSAGAAPGPPQPPPAAAGPSLAERPAQFIAGGAPSALKPSLRKQSSRKLSSEAGTEAGTEAGAGAGADVQPGSLATAAAVVPVEKEPKRVTFGPKIEYQMPADPSRRAASRPGHRASAVEQQPLQQPVLVFDVEDDEQGEDEAGGGGGGGGGEGAPGRRRVARQRGPAVGPQGTLRVMEAAEVVRAVRSGVEEKEQEQAEAAAGLTDAELAASMREKGTPGGITPRAMRLWFPPAAGGKGVGRRAGGTAAQCRPQQQQQPQAPHRPEAAAPPQQPQQQQPRSSPAGAAAAHEPSAVVAGGGGTPPAGRPPSSTSQQPGGAAAGSPSRVPAADTAGPTESTHAPPAAAAAAVAAAEAGEQPVSIREATAQGAGAQPLRPGSGHGGETGTRQPGPNGRPAAAGALRRFLPNASQQGGRRRVIFLEGVQGSAGGGGAGEGSGRGQGQTAQGAAAGRGAGAGAGAAGPPVRGAACSQQHQGQEGMGAAAELSGWSQGNEAAEAEAAAKAAQDSPAGRAAAAADAAAGTGAAAQGAGADPAVAEAARAAASPDGETAVPPGGPSEAGAPASPRGPDASAVGSGSGGGAAGSTGAGQAAVSVSAAASDCAADAAISNHQSGRAGAKPALRNPGRSLSDPWAPWSEPPKAAAAAVPKVHVVHVRSDKRPRGGGVPIPPQDQPYFSEEEDEDGDEEEDARYDERFVHDDRDADEMADDLYAGTLAGADAENEAEVEEVEEEEQAAGPTRGSVGTRHRTVEAQPGSRGTGGKSGVRGTAAAAGGVNAAGSDASGGRNGSLWKARRQQQQQHRRHHHHDHDRHHARPTQQPPQRRATAEAEAADVPPSAAARAGPSAAEQRAAGREGTGPHLEQPQPQLQPAPCYPPDAHRRPPLEPDHCAEAESASALSSCLSASSSASSYSTCQYTESSSSQAEDSGALPTRGVEHLDSGAEPGQGPGPGPPPTAAAIGGGGSSSGGTHAGKEGGGGGGEQQQQQQQQQQRQEEGEEAALPTLEPWMLRDDLDSLSGGDDDEDDGASSAGSVDDYNYKSMLPYFHRTTLHYRTVLSPYNQVQMALVGWVNSRTVAFAVGIGLGPLMDPGPALDDAAYAEEGAGGVPDLTALQARGVLLQLLAAPVRECCSQLAVRVAQSDVDRKMTALVSTFRLSGPIPSFKQPQWMLLALALLHALSRHHVPALRTSLCAPTANGGSASNGKAGDGDGGGGNAAAPPPPPPLRAGGALHPHPRLVAVLERIGFDVHYLSALVDFLVSPEY